MKPQPIAQFYFPKGKPVELDVKQKNLEAMNTAFDGKLELDKKEFEKVTSEVCNIPTFFSDILFGKINSTGKEKITRREFEIYFEREMENLDQSRRTFKTLAKANVKHIAPDDFKPLFRILLDTHPGLEFLRATPEF
jgi:serine/threonine-protein phosphatase 2A regulatory subunit B''